MEDLGINIFLGIIGFLIAVVITRAIFSIGTIVKHLKAQTWLQITMAEKQGLDLETVKQIYFFATGKLYVPRGEADQEKKS